MIKTAIIAYGYSSTTFHIPFLNTDSHYRIDAIVTSKVASVEMEFPQAHITQKMEQLDLSKIDLVVITSPNSAHFDQAHYALSHDTHVVIEKPMVASYEEAVVLSDLARERGKELVVFQNRRWDGDFLTIRSLMENKQLGTIKRFYSRWDRFRPQVRDRWREQAGEGSGILWDLGPHLIDQAISLFGTPITVQANVQMARDNAVADDNFEIFLDYGQFQAFFGSSCFHAGPNQRYKVEGSLGSYIKYGLDVQEDSLKQGLDVTDERWGQEPQDSWGILYKDEGSQLISTKPGNYGVFWYQLAQCIEQGAESPVPIDEALTVIRVLEKAHESSVTGKQISIW